MKTNSISEGGDLFNNDPFLSLDTDLDDVSEVIKHISTENRGLFEGSRTPSPQCLRDTDVYAQPSYAASYHSGYNEEMYEPPHQQPQYHHLPQNPEHYDPSKAREIGQIMMQLQDQPYQQYDVSSQQRQAYPVRQSTSQLPPARPYFNGKQEVYVQMIDEHQPPRLVYPEEKMDYEMPQETSTGFMGYASDGAYDYSYDRQQGPEYTQMNGFQKSPKAYPTPRTARVYSHSQDNITIAAYTQNHDSLPSTSTKHEIIKLLLEMTPDDLENLRKQKSSQHSSTHNSLQDINAKSTEPISPTPADPARKSSQQNLNQVPTTSTFYSSPGSGDNISVTSPSYGSPKSNSFGDNSPQGDSDNEDLDMLNMPMRKGPKTERRTAHNLIEKKYRCSINDRITYLKDMLAPEEAKLSKSATLRKAIEHINALRQQNLDLMQENERLRSALQQIGGDFAAPMKYSPQRDSKNNQAEEPSRKKKPMLDRSRVSLSVFMLVFLTYNPLSFVMSSEPITPVRNMTTVYHRTLNDMPYHEQPSSTFWERTFTQHAIIWAVNAAIVCAILTKLLVYGEPVVDRTLPLWKIFMKAKQHAQDAISACNYREAQRQLVDALHLLGRYVPSASGFEEWVSIFWQLIRHGLNGIWVGRWFARRRRSKTMPPPAVCKSHATTALVYHQLHQLHLIGIDNGENGKLSGLNLALTAVNLAESAGISSDGISHRQRADIYVHAALRAKLSLPRGLGRLWSSYFMRRARRHVRKSNTVDNIEMKSYQWLFHPLAKRFLADAAALKEVLENSRQSIHYPFSIIQSSPKPVERLTSAFKMHLLALLVNQLNSASGDVNLTDFVEISHLLLSISTAENYEVKLSEHTIEEGTEEHVNNIGQKAGTNWEDVHFGKGDPLITWWTHLVSCGLYWRHGDFGRAQTHFTLIRKCPPQLLQCELALGVGMAFCARKICINDRHKKNFSDMVWIHVRKSYEHMHKDDPPNIRTSSNMVVALNQLFHCLTYEWCLTSLMDVWQINLKSDKPYWEQHAPNQLRQLYQELLLAYKTFGRNSSYRLKFLVFKLLSRLLCGANPLATWRLLTKHCRFLVSQDDENTSFDINVQLSVVKRLRSDLRNICNAKSF